ncbi:carbonic anhydrase [Plenodomus tracheiphilus IPT5]|uniref:Carbonic anhydrase n=1 Tax=Plenodomus tracheiphilus IPT5 TaxID=1408161 RepID=A0A6A7ASM6_9PLEO|nr:carbonic anhydrase [Plenodomus tracheiphilus IPT5]
MFFKPLLFAAALAPAVLACPEHSNSRRAPLGKRQTPEEPGANTTQNDWAYEASYNWGRVNADYRLCQTGTQQSPIALSLGNGLALNHIPKFNYNGSIQGNFYNWGYGPAFTVAHENDDWTTHPSFTYDNDTVYLKGWHIHAPADHSVEGDRSKAELHLVHVDAEGHEAAVLAIRLDPGNANNTFFEQLPKMIGFDEMGVEEATSLDFTAALRSVLYFNEFWTYQGSLTSPPCHEGIRWFVARQVLFTGVSQMQDILGASTYSARAEQEVWQHRINE